MNNTVKALGYENVSLQWKDAVTAKLWDEVGAYNIKRNYFYPTNISPLWTGWFD